MRKKAENPKGPCGWPFGQQRECERGGRVFEHELRLHELEHEQRRAALLNRNSASGKFLPQQAVEPSGSRDGLTFRTNRCYGEHSRDE